MEQDKEVTLVAFRRWPKKHGGGLIALFPAIDYDNHGRYCMSYQRIGQHGAADYTGAVSSTKLVTVDDPEVQSLSRELTNGFGYRLKPIKRYVRRALPLTARSA